jgi:hypothetical protein
MVYLRCLPRNIQNVTRHCPKQMAQTIQTDPEITRTISDVITSMCGARHIHGHTTCMHTSHTCTHHINVRIASMYKSHPCTRHIHVHVSKPYCYINVNKQTITTIHTQMQHPCINYAYIHVRIHTNMRMDIPTTLDPRQICIHTPMYKQSYGMLSINLHKPKHIHVRKYTHANRNATRYYQHPYASMQANASM